MLAYIGPLVPPGLLSTTWTAVLGHVVLAAGATLYGHHAGSERATSAGKALFVGLGGTFALVTALLTFAGLTIVFLPFVWVFLPYGFVLFAILPPIIGLLYHLESTREKPDAA